MLLRFNAPRAKIVCLLAILTAAFSSRYFLPNLLRPPEAQLLAGYRSGEIFTEKGLWLTVPSFFLLSLIWLGTTAMALWRARQRQFDLHRAWMIRSYSLTFAAATIRLLALPLAILSQNPRFAAIAAVWSWPLNLFIAEFLIRSAAKGRSSASAPAVATTSAS